MQNQTISLQKFKLHTFLSLSQYKRIQTSFLQLLIKNNYMQSQTLFSLVGKIRVQRIRLNNQTHTPAYTGPWTPDDQVKLIELAQLYGPDYGIITSHFPARSRKQIRRKYEEMHERISKKVQRIEHRRLQQHRKCFFDQEVLQCNLIKWPKKPNIAESQSSQDSL